MNIYWHIGPHKTGTTALQLALAKRAVSPECRYYYPPVFDSGPGHAELAWSLLGLNGRKQDSAALDASIKAARDKGLDKIVLSSEEFARAVLADGGLDSIRRYFDSHECELILTLRPLAERVYPELQEMIKHGRSFQLSSVAEIIRLSTVRPGLRPDFVAAFMRSVGAGAVTVILVERERPAKIFESMSEVVGDSIDEPDRAVVNRSEPFIKAVWFNELNRYAEGIPWAKKRLIMEEAFGAATSKRPDIAAIQYPTLPPPLAEYLDSVWNLQLEFLHSQRTLGNVRIL